LIEHGLTSPPTQYKLYGRRFYSSKDPTNSIKVPGNYLPDISMFPTTIAPAVFFPDPIFMPCFHWRKMVSQQQQLVRQSKEDVRIQVATLSRHRVNFYFQTREVIENVFARPYFTLCTKSSLPVRDQRKVPESTADADKEVRYSKRRQTADNRKPGMTYKTVMGKRMISRKHGKVSYRAIPAAAY